MNAQTVMQCLTPIVAIVSLATTSILQFFFWYRNQRAERAQFHRALDALHHASGSGDAEKERKEFEKLRRLFLRVA